MDKKFDQKERNKLVAIIAGNIYAGLVSSAHEYWDKFPPEQLMERSIADAEKLLQLLSSKEKNEAYE